MKSNKFSDYFNDVNEEIVVYSSSNGIYRIKYNSVPLLKFSKDISGDVIELIEISKPIEIAPFFKNTIFSLTNKGSFISIEEILSKAKEVLEITKRDYDLVSKQFNFEKFRDSLYKEKYFNSVRDIINKIFSQAVGIPISITATVFATYKISGDVLMLLIVLFAFIVYVIFYIKDTKSI